MAEENQVFDCNTTDAWEEQLRRGNENKRLLVVDFTAWSYGPCQLIAPILAELAKKNPEVTFLKVYVDELKTVSEKWGVDAVPTFLFLKEGKVVDKVVGAKKDELRTKVGKHAAVTSPADDSCPTSDTCPTGATAIATATSSESATATCTATATSTATSTDTA
ncbi:PREDICTED: thioredoxin [Prunus dulcis]|uniref:PREDICTED: thioredoxin n=1 Tax=Prunus dulcis TaxID=3755 RepID=A0A5E4F465_PRUDU|nr:thioredoxin H-type-like [Prunus dulcis]KAI5353794.1 hypothetical protein L3X38_006688 [Prunus dulcis]VVA22512.1 PREDICTED: thioredoxin [Prunus dulcis]